MTMRANVKPLTHWLIYKGYTVRFTSRSPDAVTGIMTTPDGPVPFRYNPQTMRIDLDMTHNAGFEEDRDTDCEKTTITINEHGWEIKQDAHG